jgi:hypothetical protein
MKSSNLTPLVLYVSGPSTLTIFFTLGTKGIGEVGFLNTYRGKEVEDLDILLIAIVEPDLAQQKCDHSALF